MRGGRPFLAGSAVTAAVSRSAMGANDRIQMGVIGGHAATFRRMKSRME